MSFAGRLWSQRRARFAIGVTSLSAWVAAFGPWLVGDSGLSPDLARDLASPGVAGSLGRAENGVDVLTALIHGARTSLLIAATATTVSAAVGTIVGSCAAVAGGRIDAITLRVLDVLLAFPGILLAVYLAAVLPPSPAAVVAALSMTGWVGFARVARTSVMAVLTSEHVLGARALGAGWPRVLGRHVLPLASTPLVVQASFGLSQAILAEASLSFLGLGLPPGTPSWGALLDEGVAYLFVAPHLALFPGLCIAGVALTFQSLGDALRDALDVRSAAAD